MPKSTYFNLSEDKRAKIYRTLVELFQQKSIQDVTVKEIVTALEIPRGSFYQYFDSLQECYFYVLDQETVEIHQSFRALVAANDHDVMAALDQFGPVAADEIFSDKHYQLYLHKYLHMDESLHQAWQAYHLDHSNFDKLMSALADPEEIAFISAVVHALIKRLFVESWDRATFLQHYNLHTKWIKQGIAD